MNGLRTLISPAATYRSAFRLDAVRMSEIAEQAAERSWTRWDFFEALGSPGCGGFVAEVGNRPVGFTLFKAMGCQLPRQRSVVSRLINWWIAPEPETLPSRRLVCHAFVAVLPEFQRQGIARALMEEVHAQFQQIGDHFQATIPERNLPAQLLLRDLGYRAIRIVRGTDGGEDSYLMVRNMLQTDDDQAPLPASSAAVLSK
jgi:ribosomal protein S18 acetylase RimI-like enzyme